MQFLIFSDTHGNRRGMEEVLLRQPTLPDGVFFLGDGATDLSRADFPQGLSLYAVRGNCDYPGEGAPPTECLTALCGHTLFLTHGHLFGVKSGPEGLIRAGVERRADILLYGHTHKAFEAYFPAGSAPFGFVLPKPLWVFNPGSLKKGDFGLLTFTEDPGNPSGPWKVLFSHGRL